MLKPDILRSKKDFSAIYKRGKSLGDRCVVLFYKKLFKNKLFKGIFLINRNLFRFVRLKSINGPMSVRDNQYYRLVAEGKLDSVLFRRVQSSLPPVVEYDVVCLVFQAFGFYSQTVVR